MPAERLSRSNQFSSSGLRAVLATLLVLAAGGASAEQFEGEYEYPEHMPVEAGEPANSEPCPTSTRPSDGGRPRDRHSLDLRDFRLSQDHRRWAEDTAREGVLRSGYPNLPIDPGLRGNSTINIGSTITRLGNILAQQGPAPVQAAPPPQPRTIRYNDGATYTRYPDGRILETEPDGTRYETFPDGGRLVTYPDGTSVDTAPDGSSVTTTGNGRVILADPDGTTYELEPDGGATIRHPDGSTTHQEADGSAVVHGADGSVTLVDPDGTRHELNEDGSTTLRHPDGRTTVLPPINPGPDTTGGSGGGSTAGGAGSTIGIGPGPSSEDPVRVPAPSRSSGPVVSGGSVLGTGPGPSDADPVTTSTDGDGGAGTTAAEPTPEAAPRESDGDDAGADDRGAGEGTDEPEDRGYLSPDGRYGSPDHPYGNPSRFGGTCMCVTCRIYRFDPWLVDEAIDSLLDRAYPDGLLPVPTPAPNPNLGTHPGPTPGDIRHPSPIGGIGGVISPGPLIGVP